MITPFLSFMLFVVLFGCICVYWLLTPKDRARAETMLSVSIFAQVVGCAIPPFLNWLATLTPVRYDSYAAKFDELLGSPDASLRMFTETHRGFYALLLDGYGLMIPGVMIAFCYLLYVTSKTEALSFLSSVAMSAFLALPFYLVFPVSGPHYSASLPTAPPNGVPSIHMATALLIFWALRKTRCAGLGLAFALLTMLATLGLGEHYLIDLILAVPYSALIMYLNESPAEQISALRSLETIEATR